MIWDNDTDLIQLQTPTNTVQPPATPVKKVQFNLDTSDSEMPSLEKSDSTPIKTSGPTSNSERNDSPPSSVPENSFERVPSDELEEQSQVTLTFQTGPLPRSKSHEFTAHSDNAVSGMLLFITFYF